MSSTAKKTKSAASAKSVKKVGRAAKASRSTAAHGRRAMKQTSTVLQRLSGRTKRLVKSNPLRILLGASALAFAVAKLRHVV